MFDFELLKQEKIELVSNDTLLRYHDEIEKVAVMITNQRFLIFWLPKDLELFRVGRVIDSFKQKRMELILKIEINHIDKIIIGKSFDKYFLKDSNYFYLQDEFVRNYLQDKVMMVEE